MGLSNSYSNSYRYQKHHYHRIPSNPKKSKFNNQSQLEYNKHERNMSISKRQYEISNKKNNSTLKNFNKLNNNINSNFTTDLKIKNEDSCPRTFSTHV